MKYIITFILLSIILLLLYEIEHTKTDDSEKFHNKLSNIFIVLIFSPVRTNLLYRYVIR